MGVQIPPNALIIMKYKRFNQLKEDRKNIALERIDILKAMAIKRPEHAARYRELMRKLANKHRLKIDF